MLAAGTPGVRGLFIAGGVIIIFLIAGLFVVRKLRQNLMENRKNTGFDGFGLTLEQIDQMHQAGEISDEERAAMRKIVTGQKTGKENVELSDPKVDIIKETESTEDED